MTIQGAIYELNNMLSSNDIPCYWKPAIKKIIETVEQNVGEISEQTDGDLISRQAVIDLLNRLIEVERKQGTDVMNYGRERVNAYESILEEIESDYLFPSIPSAEKTAEWIKQKSGDELFPEEIVCSKCYHSNSHLDFDEHNNPIGKVFLESKYCPNCGAKMKGV